MKNILGILGRSDITGKIVSEHEDKTKEQFQMHTERKCIKQKRISVLCDDFRQLYACVSGIHRENKRRVGNSFEERTTKIFPQLIKMTH